LAYAEGFGPSFELSVQKMSVLEKKSVRSLFCAIRNRF
jgi:hypothetical protein